MRKYGPGYAFRPLFENKPVQTRVIHPNNGSGSSCNKSRSRDSVGTSGNPPTPAGAAPVKSRRVGFCLSSSQEEVTSFKSWLHRHPPHRPHHPHRFQRFAYTAPFTTPNTLRPHRPQRLPTHSTSSPPSLTAPTAPLPLSSLGRPCKCFRSIYRLPMCAQTPSTPTAFSASSSALCPPTLRRRHPPSLPPPLLCHCPHLAALASVLEVFKGFQCVPKPPPPPPPSALRPPPRPQLGSVSAIVPTYLPWLLGWGFPLFYTAPSALSTPMAPATLRRSGLCHCPDLAALGSNFHVFLSYF